MHFVCKMSDTHCYRNKKISLVCSLEDLRVPFGNCWDEEPKVTFVINPYITLKFLENSQCFKASPLVLCIYCKINAARESRAKSIKTRTIVLVCRLRSKLWTRLYLGHLGKPKYFSIFLASHNDLFKIVTILLNQRNRILWFSYCLLEFNVFRF